MSSDRHSVARTENDRIELMFDPIYHETLGRKVANPMMTDINQFDV
jgi:hypothetical protein